MGSGGDSSSSGEEDGDAEWLAAINSVSSNTFLSSGATTNGGGSSAKSNGSGVHHLTKDDDFDDHKPQKLKHYQIKAQKLLDGILEKTIEVVKNPENLDDGPTISRAGVRLFKDAPPGIVFDHRVELQGPTKRPRIVPGEEIDEKSKKFKRQLTSVAVEGKDIIAAARNRREKLLAKIEANDAAAKAAAEREAKRVAELKKVRGERWLPSIARDIRLQPQRR